MKDTKKKQRRKTFSVHDLYPADYCFDWKSFEADPEHYHFTKDDIACINAMELDKYEASTPMTPAEKRALRRWVSSGHSVKEAPPSKYPCAHCSYPPPDFLDVYRTDREIDREIKGMTEEEALSWLRENYGPAPESPEEEEECPENELVYDETPEEAHRIIRSLQRRIFHLCMFLAREGLDDEAGEYLRTHMEEPAPFEDLW